MADDAKMMKDLEAMADKTNAPAPKKDDKPAFGPGSGPMRGRRRAGGEVTAAPAPKPRVRDERVPNAVGTLVMGLVGLAVTLIGLLTIMTHLFVKMPGFFEQNLPNFGYAIVALGMYLIAKNRWRSHKTFQVAYWKNRKDPHGWKLPLIWMQGFMLNCLAIYCFGVGINWWAPATNLVLLTLGLAGFIGYLLWYVIASFTNRFPTIAGVRIAMVSLILAFTAWSAWTFSQFVMASLILGFYSLVAAIASITVAPFGSQQTRGNWLRTLCLIGAVVLLIPVGLYSLPYGKPQAPLADLGPAIQGLSGDIHAMSYSQDGSRLAMAQCLKDGWYLRIVDAQREDEKILKVRASTGKFDLSKGQGSFKPYFVMNGRAVIIDAVRDGKRNLYRVDADNGAIVQLTTEGVEEKGEGIPWSEKSGRFLYVTRGDSGYSLKALDPATGKSETLLQTVQAVLSPSWTRDADKVAYVRATRSNTGVYVMDVPTRKQRLLVANDPDAPEESLFKPEAEDIARNVPLLKRLFAPRSNDVLVLYAILPSADGFRHLYLARKGEETSFWTILPDGSGRSRIYKTRGTVRQVAWSRDGHKIYFEESQRRFGFAANHYNIKELDADLSKVVDLIAPQVSHRAPAVSPDGVKVAFTGRSGLWYPSSDRLGVWVAVLR